MILWWLWGLLCGYEYYLCGVYSEDDDRGNGVVDGRDNGFLLWFWYYEDYGYGYDDVDLGGNLCYDSGGFDGILYWLYEWLGKED